MVNLYFLSITRNEMNIAVIIVGLQDSPSESQRTAGAIRALRIPHLRTFVILNQRGLEGYAHGANKGIRRALHWGADIVIVANPDISIRRLTRALLQKGVSKYDIWGYYFRQHGETYSHGVLDAKRLSGSLVSPTSRRARPRIDFISGSFICMRRSVIDRIGMFDESYHMYYEDVEFCQRAVSAGLKIGVVPTVVYEHFESGNNQDKDIQLFRAWLRFFAHHAGWTQKFREVIRTPRTILENRRSIIREFTRRPFIKNFVTLNASSLSIKLFTFVLFLFLVRKLAPEEFGLYNLIWAQVALFMPLADLGTTNYGIFHLTSKNYRKMNALFSLRLTLGLLFAGITLAYTAVVFRSHTILVLTALSIPIMLSNAVSGSYLILTTNQAKAYVASYYSTAYNAILITVLIGFLQVSNHLTGLFIIEGVLALLYSVVLLVRTQRDMPYRFVLPSASFIASTVQRSYMYVLLTFFAGLYFKIDLFILQLYQGAAAVGLYSSGYKFFEALIFIGSSYTIAATPVYRDFLSKRSTRLNAKRKLLRDVVIMFCGGLIISILSSWIAPIVLGLLIGARFSDGLSVFRVVIFALPFLLVSAVCMNLLYLVKKTHWVVQLFAVQIVFNLIANYIFVPLFSYHASAIITVVSEVLNAVAVLPLALKGYEDFS